MPSSLSRSAVRMIAIDIDGTLLPTGGRTVSARNREALLAAEAAGVEIVIATGRRQGFALPLLEPVGLARETILISSNGSITRNFAGELLERTLLPAETARDICGVLRPYGATVMTFDREGPGCLVIESFENLHGRIALWVDSNRSFLTEVIPLESSLDGGEEPVQAMACGTLEEMRQACEALAASARAGSIAVHRTQYPKRDLCIVDVLPLGCSKGAALARLAELRGLEPGQVMAIGDNLNDVEMLSYAGQAAVMANSAPEVLEMARDRGWEITASNDEDGVAEAIGQLTSGQRKSG